MVELLTLDDERVIAFKMTGKLHDEDYKTFVPVVDEAIAEHGRVRLLAWFHDFTGWDVHALWDDIRFDATHCSTIERIAIVGENKWMEWMAKLCKPFTRATIRYFDAGEYDEAVAWVTEA